MRSRVHFQQDCDNGTNPWNGRIQPRRRSPELFRRTEQTGHDGRAQCSGCDQEADGQDRGYAGYFERPYKAVYSPPDAHETPPSSHLQAPRQRPCLLTTSSLQISASYWTFSHRGDIHRRCAPGTYNTHLLLLRLGSLASKTYLQDMARSTGFLDDLSANAVADYHTMERPIVIPSRLQA